MKNSLIIESGSSKADWIFYERNERLMELKTIGLNPKVTPIDEIKEEIFSNLNYFEQKVEEVFFYGAGVIGKEDQLKELIESHPNVKKAEVYSDLIAAARSSMKNSEERIVCILGTGSYVGLFKGDELIDSSLGHGFIIGDLCSGCEFGKIMVQDLLNRELPQKIMSQIDISTEEIKNKVYSESNPNRFLATFFPLLTANRELEYSKKLIKEQVDLLVEKGINPLLNDNIKTIDFIGSVANVLYRELSNSLPANINLNFVPKPIEGLFDYHHKVN